MKLEKKYKPETVEKKWLETWVDSLYYFDEVFDRPPYIIEATSGFDEKHSTLL